MRQSIWQYVVLAVSVTAMSTGGAAAAATPAAPADVTGLIVKVDDTAAQGTVAALDRRVDVVDAEPLPGDDLTSVQVADEHAAQALAVLNANPAVEYAERDVLLSIAGHTTNPADPEDWWEVKTGTSGLWPRVSGRDDVVVAVLDTGVDAGHPDFAGATFVHGWDYYNRDADPTDDHSHGTSVAGVIAAQHNAIGMEGVCPRCAIMPLKVLGPAGTGPVSGIISAIDHAVANGADVINMSFDGYAPVPPPGQQPQPYSLALEEAVARAVNAGVLVVAAAGNKGGTTEAYPAAYPGVVAVGATTSSDARASFSNYGSSWVDMAAPGCVYVPTINPVTTSKSYGNICGTSFSAPLVAGVAGLLKTVETTGTPSTLSTALTSTAVPVGTFVASGRLDAAAAFATLDDAPSVTFTAPADGAWIHGATPVSVDAADDLRLSRVDFTVDDIPLASVTGTSAPAHTTVWDPATAAEGPHTIRAVATDASSLQSTAARSVTVDRTAPSVAIDAPGANAILSGVVTLAATAADDVSTLPTAAVTQVTFAVDGNVVATDATAPHTFQLDTAQLTNAGHSLLVTATDRAGNSATATRTFTVSNVLAPPAGGGGAVGGGGGGGGGAGGPATPTPSPSPSPTATATAFEEPVVADAAAGGSVVTDEAGATSDQRPLQVGVTTPVAGAVSITRTATPSTATPSGYRLLGLETVIAAPAATASNPLVLDFRLHAGAIPAGLGASEVEVLRNGVVVPACSGAGATPDPCVARRTTDGTEVTISVRTSRASVWNFALAAVACPQPLRTTFVDVASTNVHAPAVACAVEQGVARGLSASSYGPAAGVTRAQMATFITNAVVAAGGNLPHGPDRFADDDGSVHESAINRLAAAGIAQGVAAGRYAPGDKVTREQMATFLVRAYEFVSGAPLPAGPDAFGDDEQRLHEPNIDKAAAAGFVAGVSATRFAPDSEVRRDQMASFLVRVLNRAVADGLT